MNLPDFLVDHPDGEIRLTGHRIGLYSVIAEYQDGQSPERIHETFPTIPLELVRKVVAFYHDNRAAVDAYVADYRAELDKLEASHTPGPGVQKLRRLMEAMRQSEAQ